MRFYKEIENGIILTVGSGSLDGVEITEQEYDTLCDLIRNKPVAPNGYEYRITESGEYKLFAVPAIELSDDDELTDEEVLNIIMGDDHL